MITQERSDVLATATKQKQRNWKEKFGVLYLGERLDGSNKQEFIADSTRPGSELGSPPGSEPATERPGQDPSGDTAERPRSAQSIG